MGHPPLDPNQISFFDDVINNHQQRMNDPLLNQRLLSQMNTWSQRAQVLSFVNATMVSPLNAGTGFPYNPLNPIDFVSTNLSLGASYKRMVAQSRAFMGPTGADATSAFDTDGLDRFHNALRQIGAGRSDALQTMQMLVNMSRQVSSSMADATMAVMNFSKSTGLDRNQIAAMTGAQVAGSNLKLTNLTTPQLMENVRTLARGNNALILPMSQATQGFREMALQRGRATTYDSMGVDNATRLMGSFINLDPMVYGQRPDLALRHAGQLSSIGQSAYLGIAMDIAAKNGKPTDITSVMAAIQNGEEWMMTGLYAQASSPGMIDVSAMMGVDAEFLLKGRRGGRLGGGFTPRFRRDAATLGEDAQQFTTAVERNAATAVQGAENIGGDISDGIAGTFDGIPPSLLGIGAGVASGAVLAGAAMGSKAIRRMVQRRMYWGGAKVAGEVVAKQGVKFGLKKIPLIGLAVGAGLGAYRYFAEGDSKGAALELASGAAATVPVIGTAASAAIDAGIIARDMGLAGGDTALAPARATPSSMSYDDAEAVFNQATGDSLKSSLPLSWNPTAPKPSTYFNSSPASVSTVLNATTTPNISAEWANIHRSGAPYNMDVVLNSQQRLAAALVSRSLRSQNSDYRLDMSYNPRPNEGEASLQMGVIDARTGRMVKTKKALDALDQSMSAVDELLRPRMQTRADSTSSDEVVKAMGSLTTALNDLKNAVSMPADTSLLWRSGGGRVPR